MKTIKRGLIKKATEENGLYDGELLTGRELEIVDDTNGSTGGYYIFYNDPKEMKGRGYDEWYETKEIMEEVLQREQERGMIIEWEH